MITMKDYNGDVSREVTIQKAVMRCFHIYQYQEPHSLIIATKADLGRRQILIRYD